ncbi:MAG: LTA synthase family protein [Gammaproteobacteria bacterium]|nr:LTA synthase family protein [Gammaproteobacteria bacterium]
MIYLPLLVGLILSLVLESLTAPAVAALAQRPWRSWLAHIGILFSLYAMLLLLLQRPLFAIAGISALQLLLLLVNNAKYSSLREPFVFHDFEYFSDALRHPRLYLPFFGMVRSLLAILAALLAIGYGLWFEVPLSAQIPLLSWLPQVLLLLLAGVVMCGLSCRYPPQVTLDPQDDLARVGFIASLWAYGCLARVPLQLNECDSLLARPLARSVSLNATLPQIVVVQSESFFDPRRAFPFIRGDLLKRFDLLRYRAIRSGALDVPVWGANTVRTESAFLTGLSDSVLGVHRFNPYRQLSRLQVPNLVRWLGRQGYRTVCIHPYPASFYLRDRVFPRLGFEQFIDIGAFDPAERCGHFIGDLALAERVEALLEKADSRPLFLFVITMENHGPLHLEKPRPEDEERYYTDRAPPHCADLTVYLRHLAHADEMLARVTAALAAGEREGVLCWYGDHVPIMPGVYAHYGEPAGETEYLLWSSRCVAAPRVERLSVTRLAEHLLDYIAER